MGSSEEPALEACLARLFEHLGIGRAHIAARSSTDWQGFAAAYPEHIASLSLICPASLDLAAARSLGERLLVVAGDHGPGPRRVRAVLPELPQAAVVTLPDYAGLTWADLAGERGDAIAAGMRELHVRAAMPPAGLPEQDGEIAGISYRVRGSGPALVLFPLELSPTQWEPLIPALAARYCTIALGGALLGSIASLEERGRSAYITLVRRFLDALAIRPGETVIEIGCGSGVIMRELARRTAGANRLYGFDMNPYFLTEARALARREGLLAHLTLSEGRAEALPVPDGVADVAFASTVFEEGDASEMLAELVRVTRPGGRVGVVVRAIDLPCIVNLPLAPALKTKVEAPGMIGGGMSPKGCADASLYSRLRALGIEGLDCFPQLSAVKPSQPRIERYHQQILSALTPGEAAAWREAVAQGAVDGTYFIAQPYHCAVGVKPA